MSEPSIMVTIDRETLQCLMDVADAAYDDLATGLEDGIYDEDAIAGWDSETIFSCVSTAKGVLGQ